MHQKNYKPHIDGLRAISILAVVFFHYSPQRLPGGFLGVDVFFIISGYLISNKLQKRENFNQEALKEFYKNRILRLLPSLHFMLLLSLFIGYVFFFPTGFEKLMEASFSATAYVSNFYFMLSEKDYFAQAFQPLLQHTWSLSIEEQFYFLFPFFLAGLKKPKVRMTLLFTGLILCLLVSIALWMQQLDKVGFYLTVPRAAGLLLGCLLSFYPPERYLKSNLFTSGSLVIFILSFIFVTEKNFNLIAILPLYIATSLCLISTAHPLRDGILSNRLMTAIGKRSYSLYLFHWPPLALSTYFAPDLKLYFLLAGLLFTFINYNLIENRFRYLNWTFLKSFSLFVLIPIIFQAAALLIVKRTDGANFRFAEHEKKFHTVDPKSHLKYEKDTRPYVLHQAPGKTKVLLFGDSHAGHFQGFLLSLARKWNFELTVLAYGNCTPGLNGDYPIENLTESKLQECADLHRELGKMAKEFDVVVLAGYYRTKVHYPKFSASFVDLLDQLHTKEIVVLSQLPEYFSKHSGEYMSFAQRYQFDLSHLFDFDVRYQLGNKMIYELSKKKIALFINFDKIMIEAGGAKISDENGDLIYRDTNHINLNGSNYIGRQFLTKPIVKKERESFKSLLEMK